MLIILPETTQIARKDYPCDACITINTFGSFQELRVNHSLSEAEIQTLESAQENNYKILRGQKYIRWACVRDGEIFTCRAIPAMADICSEYDLWSED